MWNRLLPAFIIATAACSHPSAPAPAPAAPPPSLPPASPSTAARPVSGPVEQTAYCVVEKGEIRAVPITYDPAAGDSLYEGRPLREAFPVTAEYGRSAPWYVNNEYLRFRGRIYWKFGLPRLLKTTDVVSIGRSEQGLAVFTEPRDSREPVLEFVYVPDSPGCLFQPYETELRVGNVRGR